MTKPTTTQPLYGYDRVAIFLHWLIAVLIIVQLVMGFAMVRVPEISDAIRFSFFQWHKTFGLLVLLLTIIRIVWRLMHRPPAHAPMSKIELITANAVTFLFYFLMLAVPLTGWVMVSVSPTAIPTLFFRIHNLVWPNLPLGKSAGVEALAAKSHTVLAYSFVLLLFLHIGGALKHVVIDHVPELSRMLPNKKLSRNVSSFNSRLIALGLFFVLLIGGLAIGYWQGRPAHVATTAPALLATSNVPANWQVNYEKSSLQYQVDFSKIPQNGKVGHWNASIRFSPDDLTTAKAEINLDSASVTYDDSYVSGSIQEADGLDTANYPQMKAVFDQFSKTDNGFLAKGTMTIRNVSLPIELPFQFTETNGIAHVTGTTQIARLDFGLGKENDAEGQWLGKIISIHIDVTASKNNSSQ